MLLAIFGAGASYDSNPDISPRAAMGIPLRRPPLANELFSRDFGETLAHFPELHGITELTRPQRVSAFLKPDRMVIRPITRR